MIYFPDPTHPIAMRCAYESRAKGRHYQYIAFAIAERDWPSNREELETDRVHGVIGPISDRQLSIG